MFAAVEPNHELRAHMGRGGAVSCRNGVEIRCPTTTQKYLRGVRGVDPSLVRAQRERFFFSL